MLDENQQQQLAANFDNLIKPAKEADMTVEILSTVIKDGYITITAIDCSEEHLQHMERTRDDGVEKQIEFLFDSHQKNDFLYLQKWLTSQKTTAQATTWGEALRAVQGIVTTISNNYRVWE